MSQARLEFFLVLDRRLNSSSIFDAGNRKVNFEGSRDALALAAQAIEGQEPHFDNTHPVSSFYMYLEAKRLAAEGITGGAQKLKTALQILNKTYGGPESIDLIEMSQGWSSSQLERVLVAGKEIRRSVGIDPRTGIRRANRAARLA